MRIGFFLTNYGVCRKKVIVVIKSILTVIGKKPLINLFFQRGQSTSEKLRVGKCDMINQKFIQKQSCFLFTTFENCQVY